MEVSTIGNIVVSTLFTMGLPAGGKDYTWLKQQAIEYARGRMQQDLSFNLITDYVKLSPSNKVYTLPSDCIAVNKVGYISGNRIYSLGVDNRLALPSPVEFKCEGFPSDATEKDYRWFPWYGGQNFTESLSFGSAYYRINGRQIIFSNDIPNGKLAVEYLSASGINEDTVIDGSHVRVFKLWLMREYSIHRGDKSMVSFYTNEYMVEEWNANTLQYSPALLEIATAVRSSTRLNLA